MLHNQEHSVATLSKAAEVYLKNKISTLSKDKSIRVETKINIMDMGVDSMGLVELTELVQRELNIELQPTVFFEYQNIAELAGYIAAEHSEKAAAYFNIAATNCSAQSTTQSVAALAAEPNKAEPNKSAPATKASQPNSNQSEINSVDQLFAEFNASNQTAAGKQQLDDDIAVIGMAGRFADSPDLDTYWQNIASQADMFKSIPDDHFDYQQWCQKDSTANDNIYCTTGSFIDGVGDFDASFFNISAKEAAILDPQLRLLMQVIYQTVEDAGYGSKIRGSNTGMYVGACFHDYEIELVRHLDEVNPYFGIGNALTMLANRPSYYLDLKGPSMPLDTACSASLVAINSAISALRQNECEMAFVAGTNLLLSPVHYRYFCSIGALSKSGASYPFDARADGYIPGEAVGAVLLKPLKQAQKDGDRIHAVIKGAAVNHGGHGPSFTAPSVSQEAAVLKKAWQAAGVEAESISYIEAHGTGTSLGDPIEVNGLKQAFASQTQNTEFCALGTAKAHIGHAEGAAGIAGLLKVIKSMQHKTIPAMPHLEQVNPYINLDNSPLYINRDNQEWQPVEGYPRRAGISSFGIGGAYAHVVVEEYQEEYQEQQEQQNIQSVTEAAVDKPSLFVLSAKTNERLQAYANNMADFIAAEQDKLSSAPASVAAKLNQQVSLQVRKQVANLISESVDSVHADSLFSDFGFNLFSYVTLAEQLSETWLIELNAQQIAISQTVGNLTELLLDQYQAELATEATESEATTSALSLQDIAFTMQSGREAMSVRLAVVANNKQELVERLRLFANGEEANGAEDGQTFSSEHSQGGDLSELFECDEAEQFVAQLAKANRLSQLAQLWVTGVEIDWNLLPQNAATRLQSLPTYPFAEQRYWFTDEYSAPAQQPQLQKNAKAETVATTQESDEQSTATQLATIWHKHLSVAQLDDNSDFIEQGGNSIITTQIVSEINQVFAVSVSNSDFLNAATFGAVVTLVEQELGIEQELNFEQEAEAAVFVIPKAEQQAEFALSKDQMRLWILAQMYPDNTRHNISSAYYLDGQLDSKQLEQALKLVLSNNNSLRSIFIEKEGQVLQQVQDELQLALNYHDIRAIAVEQQEQRAVELISDAALTAFDIAKGPLLRVSLIQTENDKAILSLIVHHIVADISSLDLVATELVEAYGNIQSGDTDVVLKPRQFADYLAWSEQASLEQKQQQAKQLAYWTDTLAGAKTELALPFDRARGESQTFNAKQKRFVIDSQLAASLNEAAKSAKVTRFVMMFTAFNMMLSKVCQQQDILLGVPAANRSLPESSDMVGFLANTMVLRTQVPQDKAFSQLVSEVKQNVYKAFDNQGVSYGDVVAALNLPTPKNHNPLFQILFNMIERSADMAPNAALKLAPFDLGLVTLDFDMLFTLDVRDGQILGSLDYNPDLFDDRTIDAILQVFNTLLTQIATQSAQLAVANIELPQALTDKVNPSTPVAANKLVVSASFTAEPVESSLNFWCDKMSLNYQVEFAPYNQVLQHLLDPSLALLSNQSGLNLVLVRYDDWVRFETGLNQQQQVARKQAYFDEFVSALGSASNQAQSNILMMTLPSDNQTDQALHQRFDLQLAAACNDLNKIQFIEHSQIAEYYPVNPVFDAVADKAGHVPYTQAYYTALATYVARNIYKLISKPAKVIVLDCDNTLWHGVVGELGTDGVEIDDNRRQFLDFLIEKQQQGILLALASKNNEEDALAVFKQRQDMPINIEQLVTWQINWNAKSDNIKQMAAELNLGLDSFIFIDDNPVECAEVTAACPDVTVIQFPQQAQAIAALPKHIWGLEDRSSTAEDQQRTQMYLQNVQRKRVEQQASSFSDFISSLNLDISFNPVNDDSLERVEQLMLRTNQFNATTKRRTAEEIKAGIDNDNYQCLTVNVSDRFGDYGLVGVLFYQLQQQTLVLDSFLLSCRVLGKGVEHRMVRELGEIAKQHKLDTVQLQFARSDKNAPIADFYNSIEQASWQGELAVYQLTALNASQLEFSADKPNQQAVKPVTAPQTRPMVSPQVVADIALNLNHISQIDMAVAKALGVNNTAAKSADKTQYKAPSSDIEHKLTDIYKQILQRESVGVNSSFFDLGGTSLLLVQLASQINSQIGRDVPVTTLFKYPSIAKLADFLSGGKKSKKTVSKSRARAAKQRKLMAQMRTA